MSRGQLGFPQSALEVAQLKLTAVWRLHRICHLMGVEVDDLSKDLLWGVSLRIEEPPESDSDTFNEWLDRVWFDLYSAEVEVASAMTRHSLDRAGILPLVDFAREHGLFRRTE